MAISGYRHSSAILSNVYPLRLQEANRTVIKVWFRWGLFVFGNEVIIQGKKNIFSDYQTINFLKILVAPGRPKPEI